MSMPIKKFKKFALFAPKNIYLKSSVSGGRSLKEKERKHIQDSNMRDSENHSTYVLTDDGTMMVTSYMLDNDLFDGTTPYYVPINEYCQTFMKVNPVKNFSIFILTKMMTVMVINQGMVTNYISGVHDEERLIRSAHELIKAIEVKGFKDTRIFTDVYLDPFDSSLIDFERKGVEIYSKIEKTQRIENPNVSLMRRLQNIAFTPSPYRKKEVEKQESNSSSSWVGYVTLLFLLFTLTLSGNLLFNQLKQADRIEKLIQANKNLKASVEVVGDVAKTASDSISDVKRKLAKMNSKSSEEVDSAIALQLEQIKEMLEKGEAIKNIAADNLTSERKKVLSEPFKCRIVIKSFDYLSCIYKGKQIKINSNKYTLLGNGLKVKYSSQSDTVIINRSGKMEELPISLIGI